VATKENEREERSKMSSSKKKKPSGNP